MASATGEMPRGAAPDSTSPVFSGLGRPSLFQPRLTPGCLEGSWDWGAWIMAQSGTPYPVCFCPGLCAVLTSSFFSGYYWFLSSAVPSTDVCDICLSPSGERWARVSRHLCLYPDGRLPWSRFLVPAVGFPCSSRTPAAASVSPAAPPGERLGDGIAAREHTHRKGAGAFADGGPCVRHGGTSGLHPVTSVFQVPATDGDQGSQGLKLVRTGTLADPLGRTGGQAREQVLLFVWWVIITRSQATDPRGPGIQSAP